MVCVDTKVDSLRLWKWLWTDDVVQKTHFGRKQPSERLESDSNDGVLNVPIYRVFSVQMSLSAEPQEGPETVSCGTVKAVRWQHDNIGVLLLSMTSHKKRLWHDVRIITSLTGPSSPLKSNAMNPCHW